MGPATPFCLCSCLVLRPFKFVPLSRYMFFLSFSLFLLSCSQVLGKPKLPPSQFGFPLVLSWPRSRFSTRTPSTPFSSRLFVSAGFCGFCQRFLVVALWWWGCLSRFFFLALLHLVGVLRQLREACAPAKPPTLTHLCPRTCPFSRLLLGVDRGTCRGKGGWGDRGFCDPATIDLRLGAIIAIVALTVPPQRTRVVSSVLGFFGLAFASPT